MTPLEIIIEEEKKEAHKKLYNESGWYLNEKQQATIYLIETVIDKFLTTAMQRAYEVGREENPLKGERRRIIEQIREERDTYWKERVEAKDEYWGKKYNELERRYFNALDRVNCACEVHEPLLDNLK